MNSHSTLRKILVVAVVTLTNAWAEAAPTFQITSLFSNLDGSVQFIRLNEVAGRDGQHRFGGLKLKSISHGVIKEFTFLGDLPSEKTAYAAVVVGVGGGVLGGVAQYGGMSLFTSGDYDLEPRFLATDGGVIDFAGVDQVSYAGLPTDGTRGVLRNGTTAVVTIPSGYWCGFSSPPQRCWRESSLEATLVSAYEYYNETLDHYFITASAPDIDALDSGRQPGWKRTGTQFNVGAARHVADYCSGSWYGCEGLVPAEPVCRFYLSPPDGNSHFLSASSSECAAVRAQFPGFVLETESAFFAVLPDLVTGECPRPNDSPLISVFRLWNNRTDDSDHRYTVNVLTRNALVGQGWISEGYGPSGVAFCVL